MNELHKIVKVTFVPITSTQGDFPVIATQQQKLNVVSRQVLSFRLTVTFDNEQRDAEKEEATRKFLTLVGVHSLETAWSLLFSSVQVVPFLLCKTTTSSSAKVDSWKAAFSQYLYPNTPISSFNDSQTTDSSTFFCGTPCFWSSHCYMGGTGSVVTRECDSTSLHESIATELSVIETACSPMTINPLPIVGTVGPFSSGPVDHSEHHRCLSGNSLYTSRIKSAGIRCEVIGSASSIVASEGSPLQFSAVSETGDGAGDDLPRLLESTFKIDLALPDFDAALLRCAETALSIVILLPLCFPPVTDAVTDDGDQPSILKSVLARSVGQTQVEAAASSALVFGSGVVPIQFTEPFLCSSSTSPLSNDRLVLNLSLTNVTGAAARLYSTSFDLHSGCVLDDAAAGSCAIGLTAERRLTASPLWGEMRPGADLSSMRTIDILTKLVTITPVVVGEERPPVVLHPGETYSFEFVVEVLPQLCYLLNPQSLEYLYERHYAVPHSGTGAPGGEKAGGGVRNAGAVTFGGNPIVTDCYGHAVSVAELRSILSHAYLSHLFVYYDLAAGYETTADSFHQQSLPVFNSAHNNTGLYLRYPARWSFGK